MSLFRSTERRLEFNITPSRNGYKIKKSGSAGKIKQLRNITICLFTILSICYAIISQGIFVANAGGAFIKKEGLTPITVDTGTENSAYFKNGLGQEVFCVQHSILYTQSNYEEHNLWSYFSDAQIKELSIWTWYVDNYGRGDKYQVKQIGIWALLTNKQNANITGGSVGGVSVTALLADFRNWYNSNTSDFKYGGTYYYHSSSQNMSLFWAIYDPRGNIRIEKTSGNESISKKNSLYSLLGAQYTVSQDGNIITSLITDIDGCAQISDIPAGTYEIKEVMPSLGYALSQETATVEVKGGETTTLKSQACSIETPMSNAINLVLSKYDKEYKYSESGNIAQGNAELSGAQFKFCHYAGKFSSYDEAINSGKPLRSWTFATDATGVITADNDHKVAGDELYRQASGQVCFPLGTYTIEEISPPTGYLINETKYVFQINEEGLSENLNQYAQKNVPDKVIRGGVMMPKLDAETQLNAPLGGAELTGAIFEIRNMSNLAILKKDGTNVNSGDVVCEIVTDDTGMAKTDNDELPYGTYEIREIKAPKGYKLSSERWVFNVTENGKMYIPDVVSAIDNPVVRGDISFSKKADEDGRPLNNIAFVMQNTTTLESHVVVSDENGFINTNSSWNLHSKETNYNDKAIKKQMNGQFQRDENGEFVIEDESILDAYAGIWFGQNCSGQVMNRNRDNSWEKSEATGECAKVNDAIPALPYGKYRIEEVRCQGNKGLKLVNFDIYISRDGVNLDLGTVDDKSLAVPEISTNATDMSTGNKALPYDSQVKLRDIVAYKNLNEETNYKIRGYLTNKTTGEIIDNSTIEKTFTTGKSTNKGADNITGYENGNPIYGIDSKIEMQFELDTHNLSEHEIVVMEEVYDEDNRLIATDNNMSNANQTVKVEKSVEELPVDETPDEILENIDTDKDSGEKLARTGDATTFIYAGFLLGFLALMILSISTSRVNKLRNNKS